MTILYGIPSCDTIKKARKWLNENNIDYRFHDYKKLGVPEKELKTWVKKFGWEVILNKRGTTWRKLDDALKESVDEKAAIQIMLNNPSIIKRPVLVKNKIILVGFKADEYASIIAVPLT
ncbi:FIG138056: a glutathione-dependent thiol reductase [hydrothermal vent metagenome]|uniref:FIG138056: a glutathione-dependent thiol reductase n=1 Tax=hydrothermal vent metagenome TaxID=652676 RepID=A0A3B0XT38_9ZZZZ